MGLMLVEPVANLNAAERVAVGAAFRGLDAARALPVSYQRTVAVEQAERRVARARAIIAAARCRTAGP